VRGAGVDAEVRALEDFSVRPHEDEQMVARQQLAARLFASGDHVATARSFRKDYHERHEGLPPADAPPLEDMEATERYRSPAYLTGIQWVVDYYLKGDASWSWFYPAHYAPMSVSVLSHAMDELPE
ncbi:unnamed protein product, partial [Polarella glacialis]